MSSTPTRSSHVTRIRRGMATLAAVALSGLGLLPAAHAGGSAAAASATFSWTAELPKFPCTWADNDGYACSAHFAGNVSAHLESPRWSATLTGVPVASDFAYIIPNCTDGSATAPLAVDAERTHLDGHLTRSDGTRTPITGVTLEATQYWTLDDGHLTLQIVDGTVTLRTADGESVEAMDDGVGAGASTWTPDTAQIDPFQCSGLVDGDRPAVDVAMTGTFTFADTD